MEIKLLFVKERDLAASGPSTLLNSSSPCALFLFNQLF